MLKNVKGTTQCKVTGGGKKWVKTATIRNQANVHLTSDPTVVATLQGLLSPAFTADLGLGEGRITLADVTKSSKKPKC